MTEAPTAMAETPTAAAASSGGTIALLLPETKTTRYETADKPDFEAKMKELCPDCQIIYSNANQDATQQLSQAEAALTNGAQVLVLDPVDSAAAATIANKSTVSFGRLWFRESPDSEFGWRQLLHLV